MADAAENVIFDEKTPKISENDGKCVKMSECVKMRECVSPSGNEIFEYFFPSSGFRVFFVDVDSPQVHGKFILPTEVHDDDGLPHILEHLIFLGSHEYPYRATLDGISTRCLSEGTDAATMSDQTEYTYCTVGQEGFLSLLKPYLYHIVRPSLKDEFFPLEVYHLDPDGTGVGVVHSELKSCENVSSSLEYYEMRKGIFPGDSGYRYQTGGVIDCLKKTNNERAKEYHKTFYRLDNISFVVSGKVDKTAILEAVSDTLDNLLAKQDESTFLMEYDDFFKPSVKRPWTSPINFAPLEASCVRTIQFPSDDEEFGNVLLSWRGPFWNQFFETAAIDVIGTYLTQSTIGTLEKGLVKISDPYCSSADFVLECSKATFYYLELSDVPYKTEAGSKMEAIGTVTRHLLRQLYDEGFDMGRLKNIIKRMRWNALLEMESSPHTTHADAIAEYVVNASKKEEFEASINVDTIYNFLESQEASYWKKTLLDYFISNPYCEVQSFPSLAKIEELNKMENTLKEENALKISKEEAENIRRGYEEMKIEQSKAIPDEVLKSFQRASIDGIHISETPVKMNFGGHQAKEYSKLPFNLSTYDLQSNFCHFSLYFHIPSDFTLHMKQTLRLLAQALFDCDVCVEGKILSPEEFSDILHQTTVSYSSSVGVREWILLEFFKVDIVVPYENYEKAVGLVYSALFNLQFNAKRLKYQIIALEASLKKCARDAEYLLNEMESAIRFPLESTINCFSAFQTERFLGEMKNKLPKLLEDINDVYRRIFDVNNLLLFVCATFSKLPTDWLKSWEKFDRGKTPNSQRMHLPLSRSFLAHNSSEASLPYGNHIYTGIGSTDASSVRVATKCDLGFTHAHVPAMLVLCSFFNRCEGPMYRAIRGGGYAYGFNFDHVISTGDLVLEVSPADEVVKALEVALTCIKDYAEGRTELLESDLDAAKTCAVFDLMRKEKSVMRHAKEQNLLALNGLPSTYNSELLRKINMLTREDLLEVMREYALDLTKFSPSKEDFKDFKSVTLVTNIKHSKTIGKSFSEEICEMTNVSSKQLKEWINLKLIGLKPMVSTKRRKC